MKKLGPVESAQQLAELIQQVGFVPLFRGGVPGYSVEELTPEHLWWTGEDSAPWQWRALLAARPDVAYGKLFGKKAGFVARAWYPVLAACRRDGYDYDARYEEGLLPRREYRLMQQLEGGERLAAHELRRRAGFGKGGEPGFEGAVTSLQMQCYVLVGGFARKRARDGREYGWPVSLYCTPEGKFGADEVRAGYRLGREEALGQMEEHLARFLPQAEGPALRRLLGWRK